MNETKRPTEHPMPTKPRPTPKVLAVRVQDIDMPFFSMMEFMIKWALASIPAFLVLSVLFCVVLGIALGGIGLLLMILIAPMFA